MSLELGIEASGAVGRLGTWSRASTVGRQASQPSSIALAGTKCAIDQKLRLRHQASRCCERKAWHDWIATEPSQPPTPPVLPSPGGRLQRQIHQERSFRTNREHDQRPKRRFFSLPAGQYKPPPVRGYLIRQPVGGGHCADQDEDRGSINAARATASSIFDLKPLQPTASTPSTIWQPNSIEMLGITFISFTR